MDVPYFKGGARRGGTVFHCPLYGSNKADHHKLHIFDLCQKGVRKWGSIPHQFWWDQPMDLEAAIAVALDMDMATGMEEEDPGMIIGFHLRSNNR